MTSAAINRARDEEQRAVKFGFERLELEYKVDQIRGISQAAANVLRALIKEEKPQPTKKNLSEHRS